MVSEDGKSLKALMSFFYDLLAHGEMDLRGTLLGYAGETSSDRWLFKMNKTTGSDSGYYFTNAAVNLDPKQDAISSVEYWIGKATNPQNHYAYDRCVIVKPKPKP